MNALTANPTGRGKMAQQLEAVNRALARQRPALSQAGMAARVTSNGVTQRPVNSTKRPTTAFKPVWL